MTWHPLPALDGTTHALFLDFDGTLAPLQDDPHSVALPPHGASILERCNVALSGALALISGRSLTDLAARTPAELWRLGSHGLERAEPGQTVIPAQHGAPDALRTQLTTIVRHNAACWLEEKGPVLALHYRGAPDLGPDLETAMAEIIAGEEGYILTHGKLVIEAKPAAANKGRAVDTMMRLPIFSGRVPIMVGDDKTDEDGFAAVQALGGHGIKVGSGDSTANYRLDNPDAVWQWLSGSDA